MSQDRAVVERSAARYDLETAPQLSDHVLAALQDISPHVVLDLTGVTFMDSTGLKVLLSIQRRADLAGAGSPSRRRPDRRQGARGLTGLDQTFAIYDTLADVPRRRPAPVPRTHPSPATQRPRPDQVDPLLHLLGARLRGERPATGLTQLGVHRAVRHPGAVVPGTDERVSSLRSAGTARWAAAVAGGGR